MCRFRMSLGPAVLACPRPHRRTRPSLPVYFSQRSIVQSATPPAHGAGGSAAPGAGTGTSTPARRPRLQPSVAVTPNMATVTPVSRWWCRTDYWCSLCREPHNNWNEHRGKRDHICLEMFYDALVHYDRRWDPSEVWAGAEQHLLRPRASRSPAEEEEHSPFLTYLRTFDRAEPAARRRTLLSALTYLQKRKALDLNAAVLSSASMHGTLVLFKELFPALANMFSFAEAKEISALTQMVASTYNSETVFDLCRLDQLLPQEVLEARARTAASATGAADIALGGGGGGGDAVNVPYHFKGTVCRAVLGALRWSLEPDAVAAPAAVRCDDARDGYLAVLAAYAARLLLAELLACKISEYVVRVEGVVRQAAGLREMAEYRHVTSSVFLPSTPTNSPAESAKRRCRGLTPTRGAVPHAPASAVARARSRPYFAGKPEVVPPTDNWGMLRYMEDGYLFHQDFGKSRNDADTHNRKRAIKTRRGALIKK